MQNIHSAEESEVAKIQSIRHKLAEDEENSAHKHASNVTALADKYSELLQQVGFKLMSFLKLFFWG